MTEFSSWQAYWHFSAHVQRERRYILSAEARAFIVAVVATAETRTDKLAAGTRFWRAQCGCEFQQYFQEGVHDDLPVPYKRKRMFPDGGPATEGRANSKGIPVLYGATQLETAVAEIRPWIGSHVSVALVRLLRDVRLVDFTKAMQGPIYFGEPSPEEREKAVWRDLDRAFSTPVTRMDDDTSYVPTQIVAESLREAGFDGLAYNSALGSGLNLVFFNLDVAIVERCFVQKVTAVEIKSAREPDSTVLYDADDQTELSEGT